MQFKRIALASAITSILAGCGADDQPYEYLSKPSNTYTRDQIKTDQVYLYMPSMAHAPRYAGSMAPFMQGQEKLVTVAFEANNDSAKSGELKVRMISPDVISQGEIDQKALGRWIERADDQSLVLSIPVDYVDYQCKENDYNECTNKEEKVDNNEIPWYQRTYFEPDFPKTTIAEASWNDLLTFAEGCYTKVGTPRLANDPKTGWKGYEITADGVLNFELMQDYRVTNNWYCMINSLISNDMDMDKLSFSVSQFYSLVPLDLVRSPSQNTKTARSVSHGIYEPVIYLKGDEDTFGFFANEVGRPDPSYVGGQFDQTFQYLHRFNPKLPYIDYHLSDSFNQNAETLFFKQVTKEVIERINPQLAKVGVPQIRLHEPSGKQSGDLRYNVINLIDEPLDNGLAGYGPSAVNPLTGEIVHAHVNQYSGVLRSISDILWDRIANDYNRGRVTPVEVSSAINESTSPTHTSVTNGSGVIHYDAHQNVDATEAINLEEAQSIPAAYQSLADVVKAVQEELTYGEEDVSFEEMSALRELERRLWAENNMYPVSELRAGATLKSLPTTIGGITFNFQDKSLWKDGEVGVVGKLKEWNDLSEKQQADLGLFITGVFYAKTLVHELGHNFGLRHNFKGSNDAKNYFTQSELAEHGLRTVPGYSSIMDYNPSMLNALAVFGPYDLAVLRFGYKRQVEAQKTVTNGDNTQSITQVYLHAGDYDDQLRQEALDPFSTPSSLTYDGTIKALESAHPDKPLREFLYCTDGNVSLNDDCNRHDEGRNRAEIMAFKLESYEDNYYKRTLRGMSDRFSESTAMSYAQRRVSEFMDWRNSLHIFERYQDMVFSRPLSNIQMLGLPISNLAYCNDEANATVWPFEVFCGSPKSVDMARDKLINIVLTPDHTCELKAADGAISYRPLAEIISVYSQRNNFPINYVPTSCFDETVKQSLAADLTVVGEIGKYLNSGKAPRPAPVNNYSNYIDYIGHWPDILAASATLVDRVGRRDSTDRSTKSLIELPDVYGLKDGYFQFSDKGQMLLSTLILGENLLWLNFKDSQGNYHKAQGEFTAFSWNNKIDRMPYFGSYSVRKSFGLPLYEEVPLNKAILTAMVLHSAGKMVDQRDEVFARSITMRSESVGSGDSVRTFVRSNGATYYATKENSYAWYMLGFTQDYKALLAREAEIALDPAKTYDDVVLTTIKLADFQDAAKRKNLEKQYRYQLQSLQYLPIYNRTSYLRDDLAAH
ncbi:zinc-dependent metalloprotease [Vibrio cholerae]|uniref:zinc-dependent metalloprotease n=1 Tax=Vibrio cholerae TaxID=666 RepID=UPI0011D390B1|nr:zinc-dependent metalloprotease [Vibrio cholerae]EGR1134344.1 ATPase [Vibrio cholerae]TXZ00037.1 ATPase [Vibrio cholerae]GHX98219.1 MoxR-like ATPase [Vibrio cholerae]